jgi:hypothetical protein
MRTVEWSTACATAELRRLLRAAVVFSNGMGSGVQNSVIPKQSGGKEVPRTAEYLRGYRPHFRASAQKWL